MMYLLKWGINKPQVVLHQVFQRRIAVNTNLTTHSGGYLKNGQLASGIGGQFAPE
jgi:hypothetical protein